MSKKEVANLVKALPSNIESNKVGKPSKIIKNLLLKRQREHADSVRLMRSKMQLTKKEIEKELRIGVQNLRQSLDNSKNQIGILMETRIKKHSQIIDLNKDVFDSVLNKIWNMNQKRIAKANEFYKFCTNLEEKRSEQFKIILRECYQKMHTNYYILPHDIQHFFENEILDINKITLGNYHHYQEFYYDLKLQLENDMKNWIFEMKDYKDKYKTELKRLQIQQYEGEKFDDDNSQSQSDSQLEKLNQNLLDLEIWSKQTQETLSSLDNNARKLVSLYKMAVVNVFNRFFDVFQKVTDAMIDERKADNADIGFINSEIFTPLIEDLSKQYTCEISDLQKLWNEITNLMQSNIQNTYSFLQGSAHLWDAHFKRLEDLQSLVLKDLKNVIDKNDRISQEYDKTLNTAFDKLRQEPTSAKLDKSLKKTLKLWDSAAKGFESNCKKEKKVLKNYKKFIDKEIDLVIAEIDRFLNENSYSSLNLQTSQDITHGDLSLLQENLIPNQMKACQFQVEAVNNWMFGLWEAIKFYMLTCKKELTDQAEVWIQKQSEKLEKRLQVKMSVHKPRYQRIQAVIYDVRLAELEQHLEQYQQLELKIGQEIDDLKTSNQGCKVIQEEMLQDFTSKIAGIEQKLKDSKNSKQIEYLIKTLESLMGETLVDLNRKLDTVSKVNEDAENTCNAFLKDFRQSMKLFSEGGNFSSDEAKLFAKKLKSLSKTIPKKVGLVQKEVNSIHSKAVGDFQTQQGDILYRLELSKKEFIQNEVTIESIKKLQTEIRREVYDVKYKMKEVEAYTKYFVKNAKVQSENYDDFDNLRANFDTTLEKISELGTYLRHPELGETQEISMISVLKNKISKNFRSIDEKARVFYNNHPGGPGGIVNVGKFQQNVGDFLDEVRAVFDNYHSQIEICWMECVQFLITHILNLFKFLDKYYEDSLSKFMLKSLTNFDSQLNQVYKSMKREEAKLENDYFKIFNDLKSEYGAKNRFGFLRDLYLRTAEISDGHKEMMDVFVEEIQKSITEQYDFIKEKSQFIKGKLENLEENDDLMNVIEILYTQFSQRLEYLQNYLMDKTEGNENITEIKNYLGGNDNVILDRCNTKLLEKMSDFAIFKKSFSFNIEPINRCDIEHFVEENLELIGQKYKKVIEDINGMRNLPEKVLKEFKAIWYPEDLINVDNS